MTASLSSGFNGVVYSVKAMFFIFNSVFVIKVSIRGILINYIIQCN